MPAEELRAAALEALSQDRDVELNLGEVDHLDASALQILLALDREQKQRGHRLEVEQVSAHMREWFAYAGAAEELRLPVEANEQ
jgi:ABC-type transporter Mla MlaB component